MDTHKIIIAIVILTLFVLVLYFCNKTKPLETFYRWTRDQKTRSFDLFRSILPPDMAKDKNLLECLISELSRKMSFEDFKAKNNTERLESILYIKENCKLQPWTDDQLVRSFDLFRSILPTEDDNMLECVISELSRKMSFKDFLAQNNIQRFQSILGLKENCMKHCMKKTGDQLNLYFDLV